MATTTNYYERSFVQRCYDAEEEMPRQGIYEQSATQNDHIGTKLVFPDGRVFRYAQCGAVAITRNLMQQGPDPAAAGSPSSSKFLSITQTGYPQVAGDTDITVLVTTGSAVPDNAFAGGFVQFTTGTNKDTYRVLASKLDATDTELHLLLDSPIRNAIAATAKMTVTPPRWYKTIVTPVTTATEAAAGVPLIDVTISYYYWAQTKGPCPMTVDTGDTLVIGGMAGIPATNAVAGTCGNATATGYAFPVYGRVLAISAADETALIDLLLD
jgi:hypothetical protein